MTHQLAVITSPVLSLPHEVMERIFNWYALGGNLGTLLLVCRRWTAIAYNVPHLWSRVSITDYPASSKGSIGCTDLNHLRSVLSRSRSTPLHIKIRYTNCTSNADLPPSSFKHQSLASANRTEAIILILRNDIICRRASSRSLPPRMLSARQGEHGSRNCRGNWPT